MIAVSQDPVDSCFTDSREESKRSKKRMYYRKKLKQKTEKVETENMRETVTVCYSISKPDNSLLGSFVSLKSAKEILSISDVISLVFSDKVDAKACNSVSELCTNEIFFFFVDPNPLLSVIDHLSLDEKERYYLTFRTLRRSHES